jgi:eukaryotic-like serine/threonine-protein kinase
MDLPARLGKYELIEFLGGGMSHVYRATDTVIGRTVAVKILTPESSGDQEVKERFLQEARMAGNISHENVISIFDFGEIEGLPFMVMEFLQGDSLRNLIRDAATGDLQQRLQIAVQAARALEFVHSHQMIHRDIKPDNIHVNPKGVVKLIDFGIAKMQDLTRTRPGYVLGTPYYMAPEQVRGEKLTPLVDVYAFGVLLFELMSGVKPFKATTVEEIFHRILSEQFDFTPLRQAGVSEPLYVLIVQCVAKNPAERPSGLKEVRERLEAMLAPPPPRSIETPAAQLRPTSDTPAPARPGSNKPASSKLNPNRLTSKWIAAIAILAVAVLIGAYLVLKKTPPQPLAATIETPTGTMILIPAGSFPSGPEMQQASVPDYYVDKTEVTNAAYEQYSKARGRPLPEGFSEGRPGYPVTNITIDEARDFANWAGKRLPTMLEWEKAARGTDGRLYPWGNNADIQNANLSQGNAAGQLRPADEAGKDVSPWGILNMGGNASEFVDQLRTPSANAVLIFSPLVNPPPASNEAWYTFRGGSYRLPLPNALTYEWGAVPARFHGPDLGFRCVRDAHPAKPADVR